MREEPGAHADQVPAVVRRLHAAREVLHERDRRQGEGRALEAQAQKGYMEPAPERVWLHSPDVNCGWGG